MRAIFHPRLYADLAEIMAYYERVATPELAGPSVRIESDVGVGEGSAVPPRCALRPMAPVRSTHSFTLIL